MGQSKAAVPVVTRKPCTLYRKLTEIMEVVQTQLVLAGFTAATQLTLPLALKFSPLTKGRGLCCLSCAFCRHLGASFFWVACKFIQNVAMLASPSQTPCDDF